MPDQVLQTIRRHNMLRFGRRIGVAVSGGADSVFLLHALAELGLAAAVIHVNHRLRGAESDGDERFVRDLAERYQIPASTAQGPVSPGNVEQEARRIRYDYFRSLVEEGVCDAIATGHNRDDQGETVMFRFLRGSGTAGLAGVIPVTESRIIRPLLDVGREEIRTWLRENGYSWKEDCTNTDTGFVRNRIRLELMPALEQFNPSLAITLCGTAEWARGEEDYWSAELDRLEPEFLTRSGEVVLIDLERFCELGPAVQRRLLRRAIERVSGDLRQIGFDHVEAIRRMAESREGSGRVQLPGLDIYRSFDWLRLAPIGFDSRLERDFSVPLAVPGLTSVPERGITLKIQAVNGACAVYNNELNALDRDKCAGPLELRNWRPGDRIRRAGSPEAEKIKTLFQEFRVPLWQRRNWPVIVRGDLILWTRQFGPDASAAAGPHSSSLLLIEEQESSHGFAASIREKRAGGAVSRPADPGAEVL